MSELKTIRISGILEDLNNGLSRPEIATKYEISPAEVKVLFEHEKLKGKKARKKLVLTFQLEDDTDDVVSDVVEPVASATPEEELVTEEAPAEAVADPIANADEPIFS